MTPHRFFRSAGTTLPGAVAACLATALLAAALSTSAPAAAAQYEEGTHYVKLAVPVATTDGDRVEVAEVFSYACVHCKTFDPTLEAWRRAQPDDVNFRRVPAVFNQTWALFAQAFYTAEVLGVTDEVHEPMFRAIHEQGVDLRDPVLLAQLFETEAGIAPDEFTQIFNSFGVRSRVQQASAHGRAYGVTGVPTLVIDGQYRTDGQMAGNNTNMLQIVNHLIDMQREARGMSPVAAGDQPAVPSPPSNLSVESD